MFPRAVRQLTVLFTLIQLVVFLLISVTVYLYFLGAYPSENFGGEGQNNTSETTVAATLGSVLFVGFCALLVFAPVASYLTARRVLAPLKTAYKLQEQFVDDAAHELRTPLSVIRGETELALMRQRSPEEYRKALANIASSSNGLIDLTEILLLMARGDQQEITESFVDVDINIVVSTTVRDLNAATVTVKFGPSPLLVTGSAALLQRAVANLVDNALKFGQGQPVVVNVSSRLGRVVIDVHDQGPGMSGETLGLAGRRFWRAEETRTTPGHGLGLAIVQRISTLHGGIFELDSAPEKGTTARIILPLCALS